MTAYLSAPRQYRKIGTHQIMLQVMYASMPGIAIATWFFGFGILLNIAVAIICAIAFEAIAVWLRGQSPVLHLRDNSVIVTALLFALTIPPGSAWWLIVIGIGCAVLLAKHAFGGLGQNPFNPAMCGYLFLLLAFPLDMVTWHIPNNDSFANPAFSPLSWDGLKQSLLSCFTFISDAGSNYAASIDGMALATPLIEFKMAGTSALRAALNSNTSIWSREAGTGWELINIGYLLGGIYLLYRRIITWHIPFSILVTVALVSGIFYAPSSFAIYGTPYLHLLGSATMLGAFFIATDPVSAASTVRGKLIYGALIGCSIYCIRVWGSYLDSVAIAVLFGNFCAPLLDHLYRPRIYGHPRTHLLSTSEETGQ